jgi:hypothetical protein
MNKILITITGIIALTVFAATAQTNDSSGKEFGGYELTFGGAGTTINNQSEFGFDVSLSTNPFEKLPQIWVGIVQGTYWEPIFGGSTDIFADWSIPIYKEKVYINPGWSVGSVYSKEDAIIRTGPELTLQYYTSGNAFFYAGANYDMVSKGKNEVRYSFGIGVSF